jgi:hypothetical protein
LANFIFILTGIETNFQNRPFFDGKTNEKASFALTFKMNLGRNLFQSRRNQSDSEISLFIANGATFKCKGMKRHAKLEKTVDTTTKSDYSNLPLESIASID